MKIPTLHLCALFVCGIVIAACSQTTELSRFQYTPNVGIVPERSESPLAESVLYSFNAMPDGENPWAGLIDVKGTLYGTTTGGGANYCYSPTTCGTVFSVTTGGTEKVLHSFSTSDGWGPYAGLTDVKGTLYGTTTAGYLSCCDGTVFSITTGAKEKVLHTFAETGVDGYEPFAGLTHESGTLYGTTPFGGAYGHGTVFTITTGGKEKVLHSFGNGSDGSEPMYASMANVSGTLYGTTPLGGKYGVGTVFSITTGGKEKVLYNFGASANDGIVPYAGLTDLKGMLYGTTFEGGAYSFGTVYSITTGGTENVLHSFGKGTDGSNPYARLIYVSGTLYGTTYGGGAHGYGTVFSSTP